MENLFNNILVEISGFLARTLSVYAILAVLVSIILFAVILFIYKAVSKKNGLSFIFNGYAILVFIYLLNASLAEKFYSSVMFNSYLNVLVIISVLLVLVILCNLVLLISFKKSKIKVPEMKFLEVPSIKNESDKGVEFINCVEQGGSVYSGYIDVRYIKSLIEKLKEKTLELDDEAKIEEFEVYLLNFVNRQPNIKERDKLSNYVGDLIKKLAKYDAV